MGGAPLPAYEVDTSRWPIVTMRATALVADMDALERTYVLMDAVLARRERFATMLDLRGAHSSAERRKKFSDWVRLNNSTIRRYGVGMAVVAGSTLERGFVTAATWLFTSPVPMRVFDNSADAERWLNELLQSRGDRASKP